MTISGTLVVLGTATTNPAPNGLGTIIPGTFAGDKYTPSDAWTAQAKPAIFPLAIANGGGIMPIRVDCIPSGGSGVIYRIDRWDWNRIGGTWIQPEENAYKLLTGKEWFELYVNGKDPIFLQLSSISSGTVAIYFNAGLGRAL